MKRTTTNRILSDIRQNEHIANILLIVVILVFFTVIPLKYNSPASDFKDELLTAFSAKSVNVWLMDGILKDKFVIYHDFPSVEFESHNNRSAYISYPPGALIPLYFMARAIGAKEISIDFVKHFVQFEFYFSILLLGLLFYVCLRILAVKSRLLIIVTPVLFSSLWAVLPFNFFYMQNVYFADQAVILLSIIFFLIEIALTSKQFVKWTTLLQILSCAVTFWGIFTDYYFVCITFVAICFRVIAAFEDYPAKSVPYKLFSGTWPLILSALLAVSLFIIQILSVPQGLQLLAVTFLIRTGGGADYGGIEKLVDYFVHGFSLASLPVIILAIVFSLAFPFIRKKYAKDKQMLVRWLGLIVLSTVLHTIILREHSIVHEFSMLKYNLVFVFILFALFCWMYLSFWDRISGRFKKHADIVLPLLMIGLFIGCLESFKDYNRIFYNNRVLYSQLEFSRDHSFAEFIRKNTDYYDVVYSPDYEIACEPMSVQALAVSRKRIYKVLWPDDISVKDLPGAARISIFISGKTRESSRWRELLAEKKSSGKTGNYYLFKFSKESFQSLTGRK